ncbi:hypothetical protein RJP21_02755 [Paenibacillus sp. VCA1]|uniref:hypothetical protein n=1 Tax=Paenibacillus sp. VCA1 TaxID=3039148 RepID=UPI002871A217|nr:hypothetical protein [Paenibacillus sp. VCA1]MDR9852520.1 hypothetical protein [Paenibacillus sp. VCA1]
MANWLIKKEDRLYVYEKKGLHRLQMPPETKRILEEAVLGGKPGGMAEIDQTLADRLLKRKASGSPVQPLAPAAAETRILETALPPASGEWQMLHLDEATSVLFRNVTPQNYAELMAAAEAGPQEKDDFLLDIYAGHMAAASRAHAGDAGNEEAKTVLVIAKDAKRIAEEKELLSDYALEEFDLRERLAEEDRFEWTGMIDAMERLESRIITSFLFRRNEWIQVPYKLANAEDGSFFSGESGAEQIVYASCRNLELRLERMDPEAAWLVAAGSRHGLHRLAQFLMTNDALEQGPVERQVIPYAGLIPNGRRIDAMINRFVKEKAQLYLHVDHIPGTSLWSAAAGTKEEPWTDRVYGTTSERAIEDALIRYYALVRQNGIRAAGPDRFRMIETQNAVNLSRPEICRAEDLYRLITRMYEVRAMRIPLLKDSGISVIQLRRKGGKQA